MNLRIDFLLDVCEIEDRCDECPKHRKKRVNIPRTLAKSRPGQANDAYSNICNVKYCQAKKNII